MNGQTFLENYYARSCRAGTAISLHLPRILALAERCLLAIEFGVKRGASSSALLLGAPRVISYDIIATREARALEQAVGNRWDYRIQDSRTAPITPCDLLLIDSVHTYAQMDAELRRHADAVKHLLVFHDVLTFGVIGAHGETGTHLWEYQAGRSVPPAALGIRPAIDELMIRDPSWKIVASYTDSHGLLVLERDGT